VAGPGPRHASGSVVSGWLSASSSQSNTASSLVVHVDEAPADDDDRPANVPSQHCDLHSSQIASLAAENTGSASSSSVFICEHLLFEVLSFLKQVG
jgi:hypothetical protein